MKPKILCVDDDPKNLKLLDAILTPRGYIVIKVQNGLLALEILKNETIDIVLLDVMMPGINGFEVCRKIKTDEKLRHIPVVMITALTSKKDRIESIEAGADDFISKPFDQAEILARIKMLLKVKSLNDSLRDAHTNINQLIFFAENIMIHFQPKNFELISTLDSIIYQVIRKKDVEFYKPTMILMGINKSDGPQDFQYFAENGVIKKRQITSVSEQIFSTEEPIQDFMDETSEENYHIREIKKILENNKIGFRNFAFVIVNKAFIIAINYDRKITKYDVSVLHAILLEVLSLESLSNQVNETENAFIYIVNALARAAEANDEDTGNHILRVGKYCALISETLQLSPRFIERIKIYACLHDVGKIHVHPDILRKPGKLSNEEFEIMKSHTITGAMIIGNHPFLQMAKVIALTHHEKYDGTGYPHGLKGDNIPLEGRISAIADVYDALRNARPYKNPFDHKTAYKIITEGDGRTLPTHFDPDVLNAFKKVAPRIEEIYETNR